MPTLAWAGFTGFELAPDAASLSLIFEAGERQLIPLIPGQVAFGSVQLAPNTAYVGWLALFPPCCEADPVALTLIVQGADGASYRFKGNDTAFAQWCFHADGQHVVFHQALLQGSYQHHYEQVRIRDGERMAVYDPPQDLSPSSAQATGLPIWAACLTPSFHQAE